MSSPFSRRELIRRSGWLALLLPLCPEAGRAAARRLADLGGQFPLTMADTANDVFDIVTYCDTVDTDAAIDFSDIPDSTTEELAAFRRVRRR